VAKLADALDLGSSEEIRESSSLSVRRSTGQQFVVRRSESPFWSLFG